MFTHQKQCYEWFSVPKLAHKIHLIYSAAVILIGSSVVKTPTRVTPRREAPQTSQMPSPVQSLLGTEALRLTNTGRRWAPPVGVKASTWLCGGTSYPHKCWFDLNRLRLFKTKRFHLGQGQLGSCEWKQHDANRLPLDTPWWDRPGVMLSHISLPLGISSWLSVSGSGVPPMGSLSTQGWPRLWHTHLSLQVYTSVCFTLAQWFSIVAAH